MSKKVIEEISSELELFRNKLSTFQTTVSYLQNAKEIAGGAIETIKKTDQNFNLRIAELKHAYYKVVEYEKTIDELVLKIKNVNFPERLDKIETSLNKALGDLGDTKDVFVDELLKVTTGIHAVVGKIDEFIINYQGILDEQIRGLKNEIESLRKYLQELDFKGIVTSAKTELIDTLNAKTETLLEKLGGLGMAVKGVAEQTEATHKMCAKEFPALSENVREETTRLNTQIQAVQSNTQAIIKTIDQIDFPTQFEKLNNELERIDGGISFIHNLLSDLQKEISVVSGGIASVKFGQSENKKIIELMNQNITAIDKRTADVMSKIESNQKTQRLQFIILLVVIVGSWIVLMIK